MLPLVLAVLQIQVSVVVPLELVEELEAVADTATIEHMRCIGGLLAVSGNMAVLVLDSLYEPQVQAASRTGVTGDCESLALSKYGRMQDTSTVRRYIWGIWHNHLPRHFTKTGADRGPLSPAYACYLSGHGAYGGPAHYPDGAPFGGNDVRLGWPVQMVSTAAGYSCLFLIDTDTPPDATGRRRFIEVARREAGRSVAPH